MDFDKLYDYVSSIPQAEFKDWLLDFLGITDHPKAPILYRLAWERGHSAGQYSVLNEAEDLIDLLD